MLETSARLLRLLSLFQGRRYWSGPDLAGRLEVTCRTLRRDVDKLRALGYPIRSTSGAEGGYQLAPGTTMPPLLLDDDEAVAVALGIRCTATGAIGGIEEASVRALAKIEQMLPARLSRRVAALQTMIVTPARPGSAADARTLAAIAGACRDHEILRFRYRDYAGTASSRNVEPYRLVHTGRRWYLVAWDLDRNDWRTFRIDRIQPRPTTGQAFTPRELPAADIAAYVSRGVWFAPPCRARIKVLAPANAVAAHFPPYIGLIEPIDAESCFLNASASSYENLAAQLVWLCAGFEVAEPPELVEQVRRLAERLQRAVAGRAVAAAG